MPDFDKLLQESLLGVNKAFEQADADLHELVAEASTALGRVTNGVVEMPLVRWSEDLNGVVYSLVVRDPADESHEGAATVGGYQVSRKGYPVRMGDTLLASSTQRMSFRPASELKSKSELQQHFEGLLSNPDSPVVANAAFFMRRASSAQQNA